jgi:hypothetical protein
MSHNLRFDLQLLGLINPQSTYPYIMASILLFTNYFKQKEALIRITIFII